MSLVGPKFQHDLFISYRHTANASNWVDVFHEQLLACLEDRVEKGKIAVWRDTDNIRAGDEWRKEIEAALDATAIFLAIITPPYFDSTVCAKELDHFLALSKDSTESVQRMIVPVYKLPRRPNLEPPELEGFNHYTFHHLDPPHKEFAPYRDIEEERCFYVQLVSLVEDLERQLYKLTGSARAQLKGTVYLALVGPELEREREKLRSDLLQRGYLVLPERPYFWSSADLESKVTADISAADLCVHFVGGADSVESKTPQRERLQLERAVDVMMHKHRPLPLVWIQPSKEARVASRSLVEYIQKELADKGVEYSQGSLEDFKNYIQDKLAKESDTDPAPTSSLPGSDIAVIVEEGDLAETKEVNALLVDKLGWNPKRLKLSGPTPRDPAAGSKTLQRCNKAMIFWGRQSEDWVNNLADELLAGHSGKDRLCVYISDPSSEEKTTFRTTKARTIFASADAAEAELREFLTAGQA